MINTERNRALLTDLFAALGREGWGEVFLAALRDDVVFPQVPECASFKLRFYFRLAVMSYTPNQREEKSARPDNTHTCLNGTARREHRSLQT